MLTMDELMSLPSGSRVHFVECNSDGETRKLRRMDWATAGHCFGKLSCSEWTGVLMSTLLDAVGVKKGAKWFSHMLELDLAINKGIRKGVNTGLRGTW
jgi:sulfane dehydrogenase subunit SoxC